MSADELESLYRQAPPVSGLDGAFAGESLGRFSRAAGLVWKGKQFHAEQGVMVNRWAFGLEAVPARVEVGPSLLDGQPALVLDYRGSSKLVWRNVRDELREIAPGVYLGRMYEIRGCHAKFVRSFVLHACPCR